MIRVHEVTGDAGTVLEGDFEAVSDRLESQRQMTNPFRAASDDHDCFVDVFGNLWNLKSGLYDVLDAATGASRALGVTDIRNVSDLTAAATMAHFVPRRYIIGRAAVVFFPFSRLGLLR